MARVAAVVVRMKVPPDQTCHRSGTGYNHNPGICHVNRQLDFNLSQYVTVLEKRDRLATKIIFELYMLSKKRTL